MSDSENKEEFFAGIKPKARYGRSLPVTRVPANVRARSTKYQERINSSVDSDIYKILKGLAILYDESIKWVITTMVMDLSEQIKKDATAVFDKTFPNRD